MKKQPLTIIRELSKELPEKDAILAEKFIKDREFEKLLEIVESDIYMVQQNELLEHPKEKFLNVDLEKLVQLKDAIEEYISFLIVPDNSEDDDWLYD